MKDKILLVLFIMITISFISSCIKEKSHASISNESCESSTETTKFSSVSSDTKGLINPYGVLENLVINNHESGNDILGYKYSTEMLNFTAFIKEPDRHIKITKEFEDSNNGCAFSFIFEINEDSLKNESIIEIRFNKLDYETNKTMIFSFDYEIGSIESFELSVEGLYDVDPLLIIDSSDCLVFSGLFKNIINEVNVFFERNWIDITV